MQAYDFAGVERFAKITYPVWVRIILARIAGNGMAIQCAMERLIPQVKVLHC